MIKGSLPAELEKKFRRRAMEKYGYGKGSFSEALEDAIKLWLRHDYELAEDEEENNRTYKEMKDELEKKHSGKYGVIADGRLIGVYLSLDEALQAELDRSFPHRMIFKIGEKQPPEVRLGWKAEMKDAGTT